MGLEVMGRFLDFLFLFKLGNEVIGDRRFVLFFFFFETVGF